MDLALIVTKATAYIANSAAKKQLLMSEYIEQQNDAGFAYTVLERKIDGMRERAVNTEAAIAAKTSEIATFDTIIASLPAGSIKDDFIEKKTLAEQDLFRLNIRARSIGGLALVLEESKLQYLLEDQTNASAILNSVNAIPATNP